MKMKFRTKLAVAFASVGIMLPLPIFVGMTTAWLIFPFWGIGLCLFLTIVKDDFS